MSERKENTVQANAWTTQPWFLRLFDDYDQYLDYLSVWYGDWSSCDPGHFNRTDYNDTFGNNDCIGYFDSDEFDAVCPDEGFLVKDHSRMLRRRSTALHKLRTQAVSEVLSRKSDDSSSAKVYKRVTFPRTQCVVLTTWREELEAMRKTLDRWEYYELLFWNIDGDTLEVSGLCSVERVASEAPVLGKRAEQLIKHAELFSRKTHHEKVRAKRNQASASSAEDADDSTGASEIEIVENNSGTTESSSARSYTAFVDRHVSGLKSAVGLPAKLQETKAPVIMVGPVSVNLICRPFLATAIYYQR